MHAIAEFFFEIRQGFIGMLSIAAVLLGMAMALITLARWVRNSLSQIQRVSPSLPLDAEFAEDFD